MKFRRHASGRARLLSRQAEFANFYGLCRVTEIVDLSHAADAPVRNARHKKGNAGTALPPALMGILKAVEPNNACRICWIGYVPDLVGRTAKRAEQINRIGISFGKILAVAHARHLRAAAFICPLLPRQVTQISRMRRISDVND